MLVDINHFQDVNAPDIDLDRDVLQFAGANESNLRHERGKFGINLATMIVSAVVFLAILAWFDLFQTSVFLSFLPHLDIDVPAHVKFWYAVIVTAFVCSIVGVVYIYHT